MTTANRKTHALQAFSRTLFFIAGITFILGLLIGGALINADSSLDEMPFSIQGRQLAIQTLLLDQLLNGLGLLVLLLTVVPAGLVAGAAGLSLFVIVKRQDLGRVVAYAEPQS